MAANEEEIDVRRIEEATDAEVEAKLINRQLGISIATGSLIYKTAVGLYLKWKAAITTFLALDDTPASYVGQKNRAVTVNSAEDGLEFSYELEENTDFDLVEYTAANGSKLKLGYDDVIPFYNDTGAELAAGTYMHLVNVTTVGSEYLPTFEKTDASEVHICTS